VLELDDGKFLTETVVAPNGTGAAGLHVHSRAEWEQMSDAEWEMVPFWKLRSRPR
jgi:hypothetical protein